MTSSVASEPTRLTRSSMRRLKEETSRSVGNADQHVGRHAEGQRDRQKNAEPGEDPERGRRPVLDGGGEFARAVASETGTAERVRRSAHQAASRGGCNDSESDDDRISVRE